MLTVVIHGLRRFSQLRLIGNRPAGIRIAIKAREVAAGNLQPHAMSLQENIAGDSGVDRYLVGLPRTRQRRLVQRLAVAQPQNAIRQIPRRPIRKYVDQLGREIGIRAALGAMPVQILDLVSRSAIGLIVIGAALGLALGFVLEWYVIDVLLLDEAGFVFPLRFPWLASGVVAAAAVVTATLVGLWPAWHATRLRIPEAIAYE